MSTSSSISLLRPSLPLVPSGKQQQKPSALRRYSSKGSCSSGSRLVRRDADIAAGTATRAPEQEGGNGVGRREAIGLGICLNVLAFFEGVGKEQEAAAAPAEDGRCSLTVAPSGLAFCDRVVGFGAAAVRGQLIKAHYVGKLQDGKVFDSSYTRGKPLTFRIGAGEVIKGWDQGILGDEGIPPMLSGGKRTLRIPPELAYGMRGAGCRGGSCIIPPDSTLFFDVEFIGKA